MVMYVMPSEITPTESQETAVTSPQALQEQEQDATSQPSARQITVSDSRAATAASPPPQGGRPIRNMNLNPRSATRRKFLSVAEANADTLRMLAAATQAQADAAKMQAEAAKTQAEASLLFAQAANKIADALTKFVNKNNQ